MRKIIISFSCYPLSLYKRSPSAESVLTVVIPLFLFTLVETRCACRLPLAL